MDLDAKKIHRLMQIFHDVPYGGVKIVMDLLHLMLQSKLGNSDPITPRPLSIAAVYFYVVLRVILGGHRVVDTIAG